MPTRVLAETTTQIVGLQQPVSSLTHLLAAPIFAVWGYYLIRRGRGSSGRVVSLVVLVVTTVFLLSMSGTYHLLSPGMARAVMRKLDVAGVFALIAGTVTPVHMILFRGVQRWAPIALVWSVAITGITLRTIYADRLSSAAGIAIFLLMGWCGVVSCIVLWKRHGFSFVEPLLGGGLAYTIGALILGLNWPTLIPGAIGAHELWHVAVLAGLALHWRFISQFAGGTLAHAATGTS